MRDPAIGVYRPRRPQATPLYRLTEALYDEVRAEWEERFEGRYGFSRGFTDKAVGAYLDCGITEPEVIRQILQHLAAKGAHDRGPTAAPPGDTQAA